MALGQVGPDALLKGPGFRSGLRPGVRPAPRWNIPKNSAFLHWGKAAVATHGAFAKGSNRSNDPNHPNYKNVLVISPENSDHPIPGNRSFRAGKRLVKYFESLGKLRKKHLTVFLSGGASSLAWLPPPPISKMKKQEIRRKLRALYRRPLTIQQLNLQRAKLCQLKAGGSARLLKRLAPSIQAKIFVLSDVAPFGMEVVGSGPFSGLPHHLLADNRSLVLAAKKASKNSGPLIEVQHSCLGSEREWARELSQIIRGALKRSQSGIIIRGGEPQVKLPSRHGRGGRQCQIAARLALEFWDEIRAGRLEILCGSSDGSDGNSGAAAVHLSTDLGAHLDARPGPGQRMKPMSISLQRQLEKAVRSFNTAPFLRKQGWIVPSFATSTNLQDLIVIRVTSHRVV